MDERKNKLSLVGVAPFNITSFIIIPAFQLAFLGDVIFQAIRHSSQWGSRQPIAVYMSAVVTSAAWIRAWYINRRARGTLKDTIATEGDCATSISALQLASGVHIDWLVWSTSSLLILADLLMRRW